MDAEEPRFPNLQHLSLPKGSLLDFPSLPLTSLTHIDLSHNLLESIPSALQAMHSLRSVNLSDNVITSVRSAPSVLGNVSTLNLARNRIECLIGLERVLGLERIDVRGNEITQWDEVGRLSVLPQVKEIWCGDNPFDELEEERWRVDLGVVFAIEGNKDTVFDDRPWSWSERRGIDAKLAARGYGPGSAAPYRGSQGGDGSLRPLGPRVGHDHAHQHQSRSTTPSTAADTNTASLPPPPPTTTMTTSTAAAAPEAAPAPGTSITSVEQATPVKSSTKAASKPATPVSVAPVQKKRKPRRVINLDEAEG